MSPKDELFLPEEQDVFPEELPPAYNSLFTQTTLSPILEDDKSRLSFFEDSGRFSIDLSAGSRTSAVVEAFSRPAQSPRMVDVTSDSSSTSPQTESGELPMWPADILLNIVLMLVGSSEEVKTCMLVGQELSRQGHRIRVATHSNFEPLVKNLGLEFFSINRDTENPVSRPSTEVLKACWNACIRPSLLDSKPIVADAIIATPLAHAHMHCAERLEIPLHILSISPWTPTRQFAHPLAQINSDDGVDQGVQNMLSFTVIEEALWHEIYDSVDHFRRDVLGLSGLPLDGGSALLRDLNIPHTYLWSSAFLRKPLDWDNGIDIAGFLPTDDQPSYTASDELTRFLESGLTTVFISLDSTLLEDPEVLLGYLKDVSEKQGVVFLLSNSFNTLRDSVDTNRIFILDDVPIEWLIPRVAVVFTHGDIHTTSLGIRYGKPMISMPVVRDQPFWSTCISNAGAGPSPIQETELSSEMFTHAISHCLKPETQESAKQLSKHIQNENGLANAVKSFYRHLPQNEMQCSINQNDLAIYRLRSRPSIRLSPVAAAVLIEERTVGRSEMELIRRRTYATLEEAVVPSVGSDSRPAAVKFPGKGLIKAIAKPTFSHISDAYTAREGRKDSDVTNINEDEKSKKDTAISLAKNVGFGSAVFLGKVAMLPFKTVYYMGETASYGVRSLQTSDHRESRQSKQENRATPRPSMQRNDSSISLNKRQLESINMHQLERGFQDPRFYDPEFRDLAVSTFQKIFEISLDDTI